MGNKEMKNYIIITLIAVSCLLFAMPSFAESFSFDPMVIGVPARPLGMGKAYVGIAEDADAMFINPAGLSNIDTLKLTSMYANLIGDINYTVIGGAVPFSDKIKLGAGSIISSVSDVPLFSGSAEALGTGSLTKSVLFLSCGIDLKDVKVGSNIKYFYQSAQGSGVSDANGSGMAIDIGLLYQAAHWLSLGINMQNISNGKMSYESGLEETIEKTTKIGIGIKARGEGGYFKAKEKLTLGLDADLSSNGTLLHAGAEYWPTSSIALRAGIDQNQGDTEIENNFTLGIGFKFSGIEFDYAYHPYSNIPDNTTHYFSISYLGEKSKQ